MKISFELNAELRDGQGKGASRRLRHAGKVPAILYGGKREPRNLTLDHTKLMLLVGDERFYSSIISLKLGSVSQAAIVKDVQMHPARNAVVHVDLQRVVEAEKIRIHVPIHFRNEATAPGVKNEGGVVSHRISDVEIVCLPKDLPEFLELDLGQMKLNDTKFLADIPLPPGVVITQLQHGKNVPVVSVHAPRAAEPEPTAEAAAAEGAVAGAAPAAGAAAPADAKAADAKAGDAKGADAKKDAAPAKKEGGGKK
jgi:large subunit ribosomal protein L25